ncbi:MAG: hypothetical protein HC892_18715 [Saprospiraceae bacterium]|nr:hypothetical protein [Saprospiraceae bacterium]
MRLTKIVFQENCDCKTRAGIGIGSSFRDLQNAFLEEVDIYYMTHLGVMAAFYSKRYSLAGGTIFIMFKENIVEKTDKNSFMVKIIEMSYDMGK